MQCLYSVKYGVFYGLRHYMLQNISLFPFLTPFIFFKALMPRTVLENFHTIFSPCIHSANNWYSPLILKFPILYAILYSLQLLILALPYFSVQLAYTHTALRVSVTVFILRAILSVIVSLLQLLLYVLELNVQLLRIMISMCMLTLMFISSIIVFYALLYAWTVSMLSLHVWDKP